MQSILKFSALYSGFPEIYADLEEGAGSVCPSKLMQCSGFSRDLCLIGGGSGVSNMSTMCSGLP